MSAGSNETTPKTILPVILCGGSGTRLWPVSRQDYPKQFCDLLGTGESLLQATAKRTKGHNAFLPPLLICNEQHRFLVAQQLTEADIDYSGILLEPVARNTAAAVLAAAHWAQCQQETKNSLLWVMPADHHIPDTESLLDSVVEILDADTEANLFTFGIKPTAPETGYGYIKPKASELALTQASQFVEKPDAETAQKYIQEGYLWNSGMFAFTAESIIQAGKNHCPQTAKHCEQAAQLAKPDLDFIRLDKEAFSQVEDISIDYAIMEKSDNVLVKKLQTNWSDIGSWPAIKNQYPSDDNGNVLVGNAHILDSKDCHIHSSSRTAAVIGCTNITLIETPDAVLAVNQSHCQSIKPLLDNLKSQNNSSATEHKKVHRPWGSYQTVDEGERFKVKRLIVKPGATLSLQKHHHRAEHWVVVKGTGLVTMGEKQRLLSENESVYIPIGVQHRLANICKVELELIEVQSGNYLSEDDIVRLDDSYGRTST